MFQDPLNVPRPDFLEREDVRIFEDAVRGFMARECVPNAEAWEKAGMVDREIWTKAGEAGILCPSVPEEYGGAGGDWPSAWHPNASLVKNPRGPISPKRQPGRAELLMTYYNNDGFGAFAAFDLVVPRTSVRGKAHCKSKSTQEMEDIEIDF